MPKERLIYADDFLDLFYVASAGQDKAFISAVEMVVEDTPTIDAVEVVRCRDCLNCGMKASIKFDGYRDDARLCMVQHAVVLPDDYCSRGVKMDAEVKHETFHPEPS